MFKGILADQQLAEFSRKFSVLGCPHNEAFNQDVHGFLRQKYFQRKKLQFYFKKLTCDPLNNTMDHSKCIASIQKEEFIKALRILLITISNSKILNYMYIRLRAKKRSCSLLGNFADIFYLEENFKPLLLRDVCTLCSGA